MAAAASGKRVLQNLLVTSSVSQLPVLENLAIRASNGQSCAPAEAGQCFWSGHKTHPDDLRTCSLTGLPIHVEYATLGDARLRPLSEMLEGTRRTADEREIWDEVAIRLGYALNVKKLRVEAAVLSPTKQHLATCSEIRTFLGTRVRQAGAIYDIHDQSIIGRIAEGKRNANHWTAHGQ